MSPFPPRRLIGPPWSPFTPARLIGPPSSCTSDRLFNPVHLITSHSCTLHRLVLIVSVSPNGFFTYTRNPALARNQILVTTQNRRRLTSPCTAYTLAGDSISRDCISPASHQATPGSMQPSRPSPLSPHLLNRRGAQSARPPRSAPSVPPSLRVTCPCGGADASPHSAPLLRPRRPAVARLLHYPALCCDAVTAASPSPRRRAAAAH